jgi:hypothetical protein
MALPLKLLAAVGSAGVASSAAFYIAMSSQNEPGEEPDEVACVAVDDRECPEGQPAIVGSAEGSPEQDEAEQDEYLCESCGAADDAFPDPWLIGPSNASEGSPSDARSNSSALAELEARIRNLENSSYFEVVSQKTEKTIFRVGPGGARFFNAAGVAVAAVGTTDAGGFFTARAPGGKEASIGTSGSSAGVRILDGGLARAELGTHAGPYAVRFPAGKGLIAGLGQSRAGTGAVLAGTLTGVVQASITVTDARAVVSLTKDGAGGAALAEATIGGGLFEASTAAGESAVKMGHNGHRYGIVLAGPVLGVPYVPRAGVPGSYFMGCASGEKPACIPEVAQQ